MATAKKLPSGSWRVQVYSHTDNDGKKHRESFTAPTKREAEAMAAEWANKKDRRKRANLTIGEAIDGYIAAKEGVLSPSTIRGYVRMRRNNIAAIENIPLPKLTSEDLQLFISDLARTMSPKTVANIYGLVSASVALYEPDLTFRVTLPTKVKKKPVSPSDKDIRALFEAASPTLKQCIALAAFGSCRRGEICALSYDDLEGNILHISKDMIQDKDNVWRVKDIPKNSDSIRDAYLPDEVLALFNGTGKLVKYPNPGSITQCFTKLRDRLGISVRFHDLRHYYASIGAVLGIPDNYLADFGGWRRGSSVMKEVYQNNITSMSELYARKMAGHFSNLINSSHESSHGN